MTVISKTLYFVYLIENDKARIIPSTKPIHIPTMNARMIIDVNLSPSRLSKPASPPFIVPKQLLACKSKASLLDRKSTRLNSSHSQTSYAVFCLQKDNNEPRESVSIGVTPLALVEVTKTKSL